MMTTSDATDHTLLAIIAALVQGDRYLNADACAVFLGLVTPKGRTDGDSSVRWPWPATVAGMARDARAGWIAAWPGNGNPHIGG